MLRFFFLSNFSVLSALFKRKKFFFFFFDASKLDKLLKTMRRMMILLLACYFKNKTRLKEIFHFIAWLAFSVFLIYCVEFELICFTTSLTCCWHSWYSNLPFPILKLKKAQCVCVCVCVCDGMFVACILSLSLFLSSFSQLLFPTQLRTVIPELFYVINGKYDVVMCAQHVFELKHKRIHFIHAHIYFQPSSVEFDEIFFFLIFIGWIYSN